MAVLELPLLSPEDIFRHHSGRFTKVPKHMGARRRGWRLRNPQSPGLGLENDGYLPREAGPSQQDRPGYTARGLGPVLSLHYYSPKPHRNWQEGIKVLLHQCEF